MEKLIHFQGKFEREIFISNKKDLLQIVDHVKKNRLDIILTDNDKKRQSVMNIDILQARDIEEQLKFKLRRRKKREKKNSIAKQLKGSLEDLKHGRYRIR